jgi:hypothetical protein
MKQFTFSAVTMDIKQHKLWVWDMAVETVGCHGCDCVMLSAGT